MKVDPTKQTLSVRWVLYLALIFVGLTTACSCVFSEQTDAPYAEAHVYENLLDNVDPWYFGIEFGPMHHHVGAMRKNQVEILPPELASQFNPSYIAFTENGTLFGMEAWRHASIDPANTIFGIRRLFGRNYSDIQSDIEGLPFRVASEGDQLTVQVNATGTPTQYTLAELESLILAKIKQVAEAYWGHEKSSVVMTVPDYFTDHQRDAIRNAGEIAGLPIARLLRESVAAGIAHELDVVDVYDEKLYLLYNLEDTLSLSVIETDMGVFDIFTGTYDICLSRSTRDIKPQGYAGKDYDDQYVSSALPADTMKVFWESLESVKRILSDGYFAKEEIQDVVFVGRSPHLPKLKEYFESYFNIKARKLKIPETTFITGASIQAGVFSDPDPCWCGPMNMLSLSIGIETSGGIMTKLVQRHTPLPTWKKKIFTTTVDNQTSVLIRVFEGERLQTANNLFLGQFELHIPPTARNAAKVEVSFEMDDSFGLNITAHERISGAKGWMELHLNNDARYSADQIDYVILQAEKHALEDQILWELLQPERTLDGRVAR